MDIGQAEVTALDFIGQLLVVQAKQMQDGGVQVVNVNRVLDWSISEFIRPAMTDATLHPPYSKRVVEATSVTLGVRRIIKK